MNLVIAVPAEGKLGPCMRALPTDRQRAFVCAMIETGGTNKLVAAQLAGYTGDSASLKVTGHRLAHDEDVLNAMHEEASRRLKSGQIQAVSTLLMIMQSSPKDSDRLKAIEMLMNRTGMHAMSEHKVVNVNQSKTDAELVKRLKLLAKEAGMDEAGLLRQVGYIEGDFTEVKEALPAPVEEEEW